MRAILVSHSHWDREWYRTFQDFRARLVDLVDHVLDLCASDPGYHFMLDGQSVVLEDYLEIRPERAKALMDLCAAGRIGIGPWYVQPDSLLPSGEAHVRNLLIGRQVGESIGSVSAEGYTPDSFGHPAQFPQILAGFGIRSFVYWRGNGSEIDELPPEYDWVAPDGSRVVACHLGSGYFTAGTAPARDLESAAKQIGPRARALADRTRSDVILLLNGMDHAPPESRTRQLAEEIAGHTGYVVDRGLLDDFVDRVIDSRSEGQSEYSGELVGARVAPLLPGVWSTRTWIKVENRRSEVALEGWAEPFAAIGRKLGLRDERPALRLAWKELLKNQAHDSICGCSRDEVHTEMAPRFEAARELGEQTARRCLERIAGLDVDRLSPWTDEFDVMVANPSPRRRTDVVRFPLDFHPFVRPSASPIDAMHPTMLQDLGAMRFTVDGTPARLVPAEPGRLKLLPDRGTYDLEFVARDVPAFGLRRARIRRAPQEIETADVVERWNLDQEGPAISVGEVSVTVREDGRFDARIGENPFAGLGELESTGDRGDTYDYDEVRGEASDLVLESVSAERRSSPCGIQELEITRRFRMPASLAPLRDARSQDTAPLEMSTVLRIVPGVSRIDMDLRVENAAEDHRLRMLFPVDEGIERFDAATTFDVADRSPGACADEGWLQPAPPTFPHQGFVHAGGLCVVAPGLAEAEVISGTPSRIAITLLRCVGSLSRSDLSSRPGPAGPGTDTPGAQCVGSLRARLSLFHGLDPAAARECELGLKAVVCGDRPLVPEGAAVLEVEPSRVLVSAMKPAEQGGDGIVLRLSNPTLRDEEVMIRFELPFDRVESVRLDEQPDGRPFDRDGPTIRLRVAAHGLRTLRIA